MTDCRTPVHRTDGEMVPIYTFAPFHTIALWAESFSAFFPLTFSTLSAPNLRGLFRFIAGDSPDFCTSKNQTQVYTIQWFAIL